MPTFLQTIVQLLITALHEAPGLVLEAKGAFHTLAAHSEDGLQKVVNVAEALSAMADHAREAAAVATGNPDKLPQPQPPTVQVSDKPEFVEVKPVVES